VITWLGTAVLTGLVVTGFWFAAALGDLPARREVPSPGDEPSSLERVLEHARSGARRARAAWWRYLRGRRSP
jgi:hypothetical protein